MFTVTFYSYKGGVGRTSALMNVATRLCARGKRVCVLDFDLEAPGLDSFGFSHPAEPMAGIVEYITSFLQTGTLPNVSEYVYDITTDDRGALFLMPAGRKDSDYQRFLSQLDWKLLYKQKNGALLVQALRKIIAREYQIDYLLIDSRTGLTDVAGICTLQLPELVVLLFNLNKQNLEGTAQVYKAIRENRINRSIGTMLVASPIPEIPEFLKLRSKRFDLARTTIGTSPELIIPYDPFVSFQESIIDDQQSKLLSKAYDDLTTKLINQNESDVINLLNSARELREAGEMQLAQMKYQDITELYPQSGEAWFEYGRFARIIREYELAATLLERAVQLLSDKDPAIGELALTQLQLGRTDLAQKSYRHLVETSDDVPLLLRISRVIAEKGQPELALEGVNRVVERHPDVPTRWAQAESWLKLGVFENAAKSFKKLAKDSPGTIAANFNAGYGAWRAGTKDWQEYFRKSIALFESEDYGPLAPREAANVFGAIAFAYSSLGLFDKARECLTAAIDIAGKVEDGLIFSFPHYEMLTKDNFISSIRLRLEELPTLTV